MRAWRIVAAVCAALALVLPMGAAAGTAGAAASTGPRCPSAMRLADIAAASRQHCVTVPFGDGWYLHEPGAWLNRGPTVSAVQLSGRLLWLAPPLPLGRRGQGPWVLYETPGTGTASGRNAAQGATRLITLPADVTRASLADGGDGVAVIDGKLPDGSAVVLVASYRHPNGERTLVKVPAKQADSLGPAVVRRGFVAVFRFAGNPAVDAAGVETVARVRDGRLGTVRRYRVGRQGARWSDEGMLVDGRAVPGLAPRPVPRLAGYRVVGFGPDSSPVLDVPAAWAVHKLPCGSCYGVEAVAPGHGQGRVTVWQSPAFTPAAMNILGFVQGPDTPMHVVAHAGRLRWLDDHTVAWSRTIREAGRRYLRVELACVPPEQGTFTVTVTVPKRDAAVAWRILATFRWS